MCFTGAEHTEHLYKLFAISSLTGIESAKVDKFVGMLSV